MTTEYTKQDKTCINCKKLVRRWNPLALLDLLIDGGDSHYQCMYEVHEKMNPITGKLKVTINTRSCRGMRRYADTDVCGPNGKMWEPSERFLKKKENLFKVLVNTGDKPE